MEQKSVCTFITPR